MRRVQDRAKKSFSMILRVEIILSVMFYQRKKIIFCEKAFELTENNTLITFFVIETIKIGIVKVLKNIFSEKVSNDL